MGNQINFLEDEIKKLREMNSYTRYHITMSGEECQINHDRSHVDKYYPNGHGVIWSGVWHVEWHFNSNCLNHPHVEYWEP